MKMFACVLALFTWMAWESHAAYVPELVSITCTPTIDGPEISCVCDQPTSSTPPMLFKVYDIVGMVLCQVELIPTDAYLPNTCSPVPNQHYFVQCSANVPKSMLTMTFPKMIGSEVAIENDLLLPEPSEHCQNTCDKWDQEKGCLVDKECRLCLRDFKTLFPGVEMDQNYCY